jgi:hypothetical protein
VADLGTDDHIVTVGVILERPSENLLAGAQGIHVGGVEEVDAGLQRVLE